MRTKSIICIWNWKKYDLLLISIPRYLRMIWRVRHHCPGFSSRLPSKRCAQVLIEKLRYLLNFNSVGIFFLFSLFLSLCLCLFHFILGGCCAPNHSQHLSLCLLAGKQMPVWLVSEVKPRRASWKASRYNRKLCITHCWRKECVLRGNHNFNVFGPIPIYHQKPAVVVFCRLLNFQFRRIFRTFCFNAHLLIQTHRMAIDRQPPQYHISSRHVTFSRHSLCQYIVTKKQNYARRHRSSPSQAENGISVQTIFVTVLNSVIVTRNKSTLGWASQGTKSAVVSSSPKTWNCEKWPLWCHRCVRVFFVPQTASTPLPPS